VKCERTQKCTDTDTVGPHLCLGIRIEDEVQEMLLNSVYYSFLRHSMFGKVSEILENFPQMLIRVLGVRNEIKKKNQMRRQSVHLPVSNQLFVTEYFV